MHVSTIISTYNGALKISGILKRLNELQDQYEELIIVIDGSTDNTVEVVQGFVTTNSKMKIISQRNLGRAGVRNTGAMHASGDLLVFFDDDMLPESECIPIHVRHHLKYPNSLLTGGISEFVSTENVEIQSYRVWLRDRWNKDLKENTEIKYDESNLGLSAANFSITKKLFVQLGMFNPHLTDGEDYDLAYRAYKKGIDIYANYKAFSWHNDEMNFEQYIKRNLEYQLARSNSKVLSMPKWKLLIYKTFTFRFWVKSVDMNFYVFLPKNIRFRFYEVILRANIIQLYK